MCRGIWLIGILVTILLLFLSATYIKKATENATVKLQDETNQITLFLCGDVMTGRGIDQILPHPGNPKIFEGYMKDARGYVAIAEEKNGHIKYPVDESYIWGDAIKEFERVRPDIKIINLETSITTNNTYWPGKGIQYRMNPKNIKCLSVVGDLYCSLGNNHILDWDYEGLVETINTLEKANISYAGAGVNYKAAIQPAIIEIERKGRVVILSYGMRSSGVYPDWAAQEKLPGVNFLPDLSTNGILKIKAIIDSIKQPGDIIVFSLHWGGNWGYEILPEETQFVHALVDIAQIDVFHGHSSHHFKAMEVYKNKLILYGCGDFINDYEGIGGKESFRDDLALMYFASLDNTTGDLVKLELTPMQIGNFRLNEVNASDLSWVHKRLKRECEKFNSIVVRKDNRLQLTW